MAAPRAGAHIERRFAEKNQLKSAENVALHFRERATLQQAKSMTYLTSTRANCRRWVIRPDGVPHELCRKAEVAGHPGRRLDAVVGRRADDDEGPDSVGPQAFLEIGAD